MSKIFGEIRNLSEKLGTLDNDFKAFRSDLMTMISTHSDRMDRIEEQLVQLIRGSDSITATEIAVTKLVETDKLLSHSVNDLDQQARSHNLRITGLMVHPQSVTEEILAFFRDKLNAHNVKSSDISNITIIKPKTLSKTCILNR